MGQKLYDTLKVNPIFDGLGICDDAKTWLVSLETEDPKIAWKECQHPEWMLWLLYCVSRFRYRSRERRTRDIKYMRELLNTYRQEFPLKDDSWIRAPLCDSEEAANWIRQAFPEPPPLCQERYHVVHYQDTFRYGH